VAVVQVKLSIWDKLNRAMILLVVAAGLLGVFFWYLPLFQQNERYRREILILDDKLAAEEKLARELKGSIEAMQHDPRMLERLAREKLGYARSNETVIRFEAPEKR